MAITPEARSLEKSTQKSFPELRLMVTDRWVPLAQTEQAHPFARFTWIEWEYGLKSVRPKKLNAEQAVAHYQKRLDLAMTDLQGTLDSCIG